MDSFETDNSVEPKLFYIVNSRNKRISCKLYECKENKKAIIIMAHGFMSDQYSRGRFPYFASKFVENSISALTFDFCGCGESESDVLTVSNHTEDLIAVIKTVKEMGFGKIVLFGYSLGSLICFKAYQKDISAIVALGACVGPMEYDWNVFFSPEILHEINKKNIAIVKQTNDNNNTQSEYLISQQTLLDFTEIDTKCLLTDITCPLLFIHGNNDDEEIQLSVHTRVGVQYLTSNSEIEIIDGADHSFFGYVEQVGNETVTWLLRVLFE